MLFGTTEEFLRSFGLQSMEDLPKLDPVEIEEWKIQAEEEATETLRNEEDDI
jgi:segregation and condensation protein B